MSTPCFSERELRRETGGESQRLRRVLAPDSGSAWPRIRSVTDHSDQGPSAILMTPGTGMLYDLEEEPLCWWGQDFLETAIMVKNRRHSKDPRESPLPVTWRPCSRIASLSACGDLGHPCNPGPLRERARQKRVTGSETWTPGGPSAAAVTVSDLRPSAKERSPGAEPRTQVCRPSPWAQQPRSGCYVTLGTR